MMLNHKAVLALLPNRDENAHKGNFGKILLLCGSRGYTGAAYLAAMGALRTGAGLVFLGVPESIWQVEHSAWNRLSCASFMPAYWISAMYHRLQSMCQAK